ncbi:uncharacterized protein JCM6883_005838 [Sporobolomyces salmoneus]|uniref:uncharacterized protein n=1 Tax=Sporobolomyces salmoneus TaxID=183962 RepID=UPI00316C65C1
MPPRARASISASLPRDISQFLSHYPSNPVRPQASANLDFYQGRIAAKPSKKKVEELQNELRGNWDELEYNHSFVQWLFPIREQGVNYQAQPLELHEIAQLRQDPIAMSRLIESYRIMLAFYGLRLVDEQTGELTLEDSTPAPSPSSYLRRFQNLERNTHNFLRITRILKCLNEFRFPQHPPSLLLYILALQASSNHYLSSPGLIRSMDGYWRHCVRDDRDREFIAQKVEEVRSGEGEWDENEYREWIKRRAAERVKENDGEDSVEKDNEREGKEDASEADKDGKESGENGKRCPIL